MPGPFEAAGSAKDATKYAALGMGARQFTGMWTQRSPYRDAAVPFLYGKFYGATRFDSILDGINREISMLLTDDRRPGSTVYNSGDFPPALSYYAFKCIQNAAEIVRVMYEGNDGSLYDATAGQKSTIFSDSAFGGGRKRMLGVGTTLFIGDNLNQKKWIFPGGWQANTAVQPGTLINVGAEPGKLQMAVGGISMTVVATESNGTSIQVYIDPENVPDQFANLQNALVSFSGLTVATSLNGNTYAVAVVSTTLGILQVTQAQSAYAETADTGTGTTGNGTTGATAPTFSVTQFGITADAGQQWKCYGTAVENWGIPAPINAPTLSPVNGTRYWQASTVLGANYAVLDTNGNIQLNQSSSAKTGRSYPTWMGTLINTYAVTIDGGVHWLNLGPPGAWSPATAYGVFGGTESLVILDSNGNLQWTGGGSGTSGGTVPTWATSVGSTTTDNTITWTCLGPGVAITTATIQYGFSTTAVDGSVSTASPVATIQGPILGAPTVANLIYIEIGGNFVADTQLDMIDIWRTAQGQSTLVLEDQIPMDPFYSGGAFTYGEMGIPDTSSSGGGALNPLIPAPIADTNNPPPKGLTGMVYHLGRVWGFVGNVLYNSGGPDTITGNGNTAWAPIDQVPYQAGIIKLLPITVENGGLLVFTTSGIQILLGTGTASNPFYTTQYCDKVNLANYDALDVLGTVISLVESNLKVSQLTVQYPFNPQSGYLEVGFPVGDQFLKVTTGGISSALYNANQVHLSWNIANTTDTGMYVSDGEFGWFRMSNAAAPESGLVWSPRAAIVGGTSAVGSVETSPGVFSLLIGPPSGGGPILQRDQTGTVFTDNGGAYPAWDSKGVTLLCSTGQVAELAWIAAKSLAVGARPVLSLLMNEIKVVPATLPWNVLQATSEDPADLARSKTAFSDRYSCDQNSFVPKGDCCLIKFDYGTQAFGDKLLDFQIYGSKEDERKAMPTQ